MNSNMAARLIQDVLTDIGRRWKIDGRLAEPTVDDVERLVRLMSDDVRKLDYDSIESGGILVKKDGDKIDVYVHVGELDEDNSI